MKLKNKTSSINFKTLIYLIVFSVTILLFLLISQNILLKYSYEKYQEKKIKNIATNISKYNIDELYKNLEKIAYNNSVCIEYYIDNEDTILYNTLMVGCGLNKNNNQIKSLINNMLSSKNIIDHVKLINKTNNTKAILSGI